jgi:hydroxymethylpyrimidine/phosphomethylpyrimidine kinase
VSGVFESSVVRDVGSRPAVALSIAGSDPSGGAGIQADLKTFHQHRVYGCAVPTLLTVQSTVIVQRVEVVPAELLAEQLDVLLSDLPPDAAKTGALGSAGNARVVAERFERTRVPLVVDTVRISKHETPLLANDARAVMLQRLLPCAALVTANAPEAAWLLGTEVENREQALAAAEKLRALGCAAVMIKGGHLIDDTATDVLVDAEGVLLLAAPRLQTRHTHGVGCALSAAICAHLARGVALREACARAKRWLTRAIEGAPGLGAGHGPIDHHAKVDDYPGGQDHGGRSRGKPQRRQRR